MNIERMKANLAAARVGLNLTAHTIDAALLGVSIARSEKDDAKLDRYLACLTDAAQGLRDIQEILCLTKATPASGSTLTESSPAPSTTVTRGCCAPRSPT